MSDVTNLPAKTDENMAFAERVRSGALLSQESWNDDRIMAIRSMYGGAAKNAGQLISFLHICQKYDLAPELNEVWLVNLGEKQGVRPVTGRDAILKVARRDPKYLGHESGVVKKNDKFIAARDGSGAVKITHEISGFDRGDIDGAYCVVKYEGRPDILIMRAWSDYAHLQNKDNWRRYGETMILTRAVTEAHRLVTNISGLFVESEFAEDEGQAASHETEAATRGRIEELREKLEGKEIEDAEYTEVEEDEPKDDAQEEQAEEASEKDEQEAPQADAGGEPEEDKTEFPPGNLTESQKRMVFKLWRGLCEVKGLTDKKVQEEMFTLRFGQKIQDLSVKRADKIVSSIAEEEQDHMIWLTEQSWED